MLSPPSPPSPHVFRLWIPRRQSQCSFYNNVSWVPGRFNYPVQPRHACKSLLIQSFLVPDDSLVRGRVTRISQEEKCLIRSGVLRRVVIKNERNALMGTKRCKYKCDTGKDRLMDG